MTSSFTCLSSSNPSANPIKLLFNEIFQATLVAFSRHSHTNLCLLSGLKLLSFVSFPAGSALLLLSGLVALSSFFPGLAIPSYLLGVASCACFRPLEIGIFGKLGVSSEERGKELAE